MKAIFISFNQAHYEDVLDLMNKSGVKGFTCWETVTGRGSNGGEPHFGDHAWPTLNSAMLVMEDRREIAEDFLQRLHKLDEAWHQMGLRVFWWNVEGTF